MSANPRSPESGDVPGWLAKIVADVRFATARGDGRGECYRAIHALADALDAKAHLLRDVLERMGITHERFGLDAGWWLNGEPEPQRFTTLNEALGAYDAMLSRLTAELSTARARADSAVQTERDEIGRAIAAELEPLPDRGDAPIAETFNHGLTTALMVVNDRRRAPSSLPQSSEATDRAE